MARRDDVLLAALDLLDEVGLDALTTRRLAAKVGIQAGSLYRHYPSKRALLDAMAGHLLAGVAEDLAPVGPEPWDDVARRVVTRVRSAMLSRRDGARLLATFHGPTDVGWRLFGGLIDRLVAVGVGRGEAGVAVDTLFGYVHGFAIEEQAHQEQAHQERVDEHAGPDTRFPAGVELILDGIRLRVPGDATTPGP